MSFRCKKMLSETILLIYVGVPYNLELRKWHYLRYFKQVRYMASLMAALLRILRIECCQKTINVSTSILNDII